MMICKECGKEVKLHAKDMCRSCYDKVTYRERNIRDRRREYFRQYKEKRKMQTIYIIICEDGGLYIGSTVDFYQRKKDHDRGNSGIQGKPLLYGYEEYPNLTKAERLELECFLILVIKPQHNRAIPTRKKISDEIRALGNEFYDKLMNGKLTGVTL